MSSPKSVSGGSSPRKSPSKASSAGSPTRSAARSPTSVRSPRSGGSPAPGSPSVKSAGTESPAGSASLSAATVLFVEDGPEPPRAECPGCEDEDLSTPKLDRSQASRPGVLNTEYIYYSATLRELAPRLTSNQDRLLIIPWLKKLFKPEYHSSRIREKRNKYLMCLVVTMMNNEIFGIFRSPPPNGALLSIEELEPTEGYPPVEWEQDTMWHETVMALPEEIRQMRCSIHQGAISCEKDHTDDMHLDEVFAFLLYLARPFVPLLQSGDDRTRIAAWMQLLCTIQAKSCASMKRLRNEYMMVLLGYLSELRVVGPFIDHPQFKPLPHLAELARIHSAQNPPSIDPASPEVAAFLAKQPTPSEGAFCYVAVTGEVVDSALNQLD